MAIDLSGCRVKMNRAQEHLYALAEIGSDAIKAEGKHLQLRAELDRDSGQYILRVATIPRDWLDRVAVVLGDVVHNLRGALDHLFWQVFCRYAGVPGPPRLRKQVQFPIKDSAERFTNFRSNHPFCKIPRRCWAIINTAQPYKRQNPHSRWFGLQGLRELSDGDKHRVLTPVLARVLGRETDDFVPSPEFAAQQPVKISDSGKYVYTKIGAEVMRMSTPSPNPDPEVEVAGYLFPHIRLPIGGTPGRDYSVYPGMREISGEVERIIRLFERIYPS